MQIAKDISSDSEKQVSRSIIIRILHSNGFHGRRPKKSHFITKVNKKKRLDYAKTYKTKDYNFWKTVLFTDESKFKIFSEEK